MLFSYNCVEEEKLVVIEMTGNLMEKSEALELLADQQEYITSGINRFVLNLAALKYVNSSGLNVLITMLTRARNAGGETVVCNVSPKVNDLLVITKLNTVFKVSPSLEEAIDFLNKQT